MELVSGIFVITFAVVLALTFALGIVVWLEVRPLQNIRPVRQHARSRQPAAPTKAAGRTVYGSMAMSE